MDGALAGVDDDVLVAEPALLDHAQLRLGATGNELPCALPAVLGVERHRLHRPLVAKLDLLVVDQRIHHHLACTKDRDSAARRMRSVAGKDRDNAVKGAQEAPARP